MMKLKELVCRDDDYVVKPTKIWLKPKIAIFVVVAILLILSKMREKNVPRHAGVLHMSLIQKIFLKSTKSPQIYKLMKLVALRI